AVRAVEAVFRTAVASVAKVVDWLKALFAFRDIWETKMALEAGATMMIDYGLTTIEQFRTRAAGWFAEQEQQLPKVFKGLRAQFGDTRGGELRSRIPAMTDASGAVVDDQALQHNPQATWML